MADNITQRDALDWLSRVKQQQDRIKKEVENITLGAGWCTDNYILNFMNHLTNDDQFKLMIALAQKGMLFDEEKLTETDLVKDDTPKQGKVTVKWVVDTYKKYLADEM